MTIDNSQGPGEIADLFGTKYSELYQSVSYDSQQMDSLKSHVKILVNEHCDGSICSCMSDHSITVEDVQDHVTKLKCGKKDGSDGVYSDHLIHGTRTLYVHLSLLFSVMLRHGSVPDSLCTSTLIPIPKSKRKSTNDSNNYRAIALSSILGKLLDKVLLTRCSSVFQTSDLQFGFKKYHSTTQCTMVVNEVVNYYLTHDSPVYCVLLDASRAFDRVNYVKLFDILLRRNLCPIVVKFLLNMYTSQMIRVRWGSHLSDVHRVYNGVKQGGVLSPILFIMYMDELLCRLSKSHKGCHIGASFMGALGYADDIVLLTPTVSSCTDLLDICASFAEEYDVIFNSSKSKLLVYGCGKFPANGLQFSGGIISQVANDNHLGNAIGVDSDTAAIDRSITELYSKTNMIMSHFSHCNVDVRYELFKTFCMPLYGCALWKYTGIDIKRFYTAWRKCVRRILGVPYTTHCNLLSYICNDDDVVTQLSRRFVKFVQTVHKSGNRVSNLCIKVALAGSRSNISDTMSLITSHFNIPRYDIFNIPVSHLKSTSVSHLADVASVIRDILHKRVNLLTCNECADMLYILCTN